MRYTKYSSHYDAENVCTKNLPVAILPTTLSADIWNIVVLTDYCDRDANEKDRDRKWVWAKIVILLPLQT